MKKFNIVVLAPNKWNGIWMNRQHIFSILGKAHNVIYSNGPLFYWDRSLPRFKESHYTTKIINQDHIKLIEFPKTLVRIPKISIWDSVVRLYFKSLIERQLDQKLPTVLYIFNPLYHEYIDQIKHDFLVYHPYDDFTKLYKTNSSVDGNQLLAKRANLVITTSNMLQKNYCDLSDNVHLVPNGVDFNMFKLWGEVTPDIPNTTSRKKVGYTGSLNSKIDIKLLLNIFSQLRHIDLYIIGGIGQVDSHQEQDLKALRELNNCYLLGNKPLSKVPSYMRKMDINIIPYRTDPNSFANAGYPLKLHEYLTVGKPIICTPIDSAFEFSEVLNIKDGQHEWAESIELILSSKTEFNSNSEQKRNDVAKQNTWQVRAKKINGLLLAGVKNAE